MPRALFIESLEKRLALPLPVVISMVASRDEWTESSDTGVEVPMPTLLVA